MNKNVLIAAIILIVSLALATSSHGQCPTQYNFFNQKAIDLFPVNYPGCRKIDFHVSIYGGSTDPITNLNGLSSIEVIGGHFRIYNTALTNLHGLENLDSVYMDFSIEHNSLLQDLEEVSDIEFIGGELAIRGNHGIHVLDTFQHLNHYESLSITGNENLQDISSLSIVNKIVKQLWVGSNPSLKSLYGLHEIDTVGEKLVIYGNDSLASLQDLSGLKYVGDRIEIKSNNLIHDLIGLENIRGDSLNVVIEGNDKLASLIGFPQSEKVHHLEIRANDALSNLEGLSVLRKIEGDFIFEYNDLFTSLAGLEELEYINGELRLASNDHLSTIDQLQNLSPDSLSTISIIDNPLLSACNTDYICSTLRTLDIPANVHDNGAGCNSFHELVSNCNIPGCVSHYVFRSQAEIDDFPSTLPFCTSLPGDLVIEETVSGNIRNVDSIRQFQAIGGSLIIRNNIKLNNLAGLQNLETIGKSLLVVGNESLMNLAGMENLTSIGASVEISENPILASLQGLQSLNTIGGTFNLSANPELQSLQSLINLNRIDSSLIISENPKLESFDGLENLQTILGDISIHHNNALTNLSALSGLNQVGASVLIYSNSSLDSLDFLNTIDSVKGSIRMNGNPALTTINAFSSVKDLKGELEIKDNPLLRTINGFQKLEWVGENVAITSNPLLSDLAELNQLSFVQDVFVLTGNGIISMNGLQNLRSVGEMSVYSNNNLTSFEGLDNLEHVDHLSISGDLLENLNPLTSLQYIGEFWITDCPKLRHLPVLNKVDSINGIVYIAGNDLLEDLTGLDSIQKINGKLSVWLCPSLTSLKGLDSLKECGNGIYIARNESLLHLSELEQLTKINGELSLIDNPVLINIDGIRNISPESIHPRSDSSSTISVEIYDNASLSACAIEPVCAVLNDRLTEVFVRNNGDGCNSPMQIIANCDLVNACLIDGLVISRQGQIDSFSLNNPLCSLVKGDVFVEEELPGNITSLQGLSQLRSIGGSLNIEGNAALEQLTGLESLEIVGGVIEISNNDILYSIDALSNVDPTYLNTQSFEEYHFILTGNSNLSVCSIQPLCSLLVEPAVKVDIQGNSSGCFNKEEAIDGCGFSSVCELGTVRDQKTIDEFPVRFPRCTELNSSLFVFRSPGEEPSDPILSLAPFAQLTTLHGGLSVRHITGLTDLTGLENLRNINGPIELRFNTVLQSLEALKDINPASVLTSVSIYDNEALTECAVKSICQLLEQNDISIGISRNGPSCNSKSEVLNECIVSVEDVEDPQELRIYPNPTTGVIHIETRPGMNVENATIEIFDMSGRQVRSLGYGSTISISGMDQGFYLVILRMGDHQDYYSRVLLTH